MKKTLFLLAFLCVSSLSANEKIPLWAPDQLPGAKASTYKEMYEIKDRCITSVAMPTIEFYPAKRDSASCVIVCPGGGYNMLAYAKEGIEVAKFLNEQGFSAAILTYRVPKMQKEALFDAQRTISLLRHDAAKFNINPKKIGIMGFSAGGHLAARLSTQYTTRTYPAKDSIDQQNMRPDFTLLVYPAYCGKNSTEISAELKVDSKTPPCFIIQAQDDTTYVPSATAYYLACAKAKVPCDLHIFSKGGHGFGLRFDNRENLKPTLTLISNWLKSFK